MILPNSIILYGKSEENNLQVAHEISVRYLYENQSQFKMMSDIERYVSSNSYPNFMNISVLEGEKEISIEQIRSMIEFLSLHPSLEGKRIVIINNADLLNRFASNAILKILEEPPLDSSIILLTTRLFSIIPTIRSRCHKIYIPNTNRISPLYSDNIKEYIIKYTMYNEDFIQNILYFIENPSKNVADFCKNIIKDKIDDFMKIVSLYTYFKSIKEISSNYSKKYLELQDFIISSKNAYLDPQSIVMMCCSIVLS